MLHHRLGISLLLLIILGQISPASAAQRVVSIDGSITETIYALGAEDKLVGVDTTSVYPAQAKQLPSVGYMRNLSAEGILSLKPDLVITTAEAGPPKVLNNLKQAGLNIHIVDTDRSIEGILDKTKKVADLLGIPERGVQLAQKIKHTTDRLNKLVDLRADQSPKVMFLLSAGSRGVHLAGKDTQAQAMIDIMGGNNVVDHFNSYKPLSPESVLSLNPDVIVIADTGEPASLVDEIPTLKLTNAYKQQRIVNANSMLLLGFGPRIGDAMALLMQSFYSEAP